MDTPMNKKLGRPPGSTRAALHVRRAVQLSLAAIASRALAGEWKAQEVLLLVASRDPSLVKGDAQ